MAMVDKTWDRDRSGSRGGTGGGTTTGDRDWDRGDRGDGDSSRGDRNWDWNRDRDWDRNRGDRNRGDTNWDWTRNQNYNYRGFDWNWNNARRIQPQQKKWKRRYNHTYNPHAGYYDTWWYPYWNSFVQPWFNPIAQWIWPNYQTYLPSQVVPGTYW